MMKLLQEQLRVNVDEKQGFVSISASMPDKAPGRTNGFKRTKYFAKKSHRS